MPNQFNLDAANVAKVAALYAGADLNLSGLVRRDLDTDFRAGIGATVDIPVPGAVKSFSKSIGDTTSALETSTIIEQTIPVQIADHIYSKVVLSEADESLNITDFTRQVTGPQTAALVTKAEALTAGVLAATPVADSITYDASAPQKAFTAARLALRKNGVKEGARLIAAAGAGVYADLLDAQDNSGSIFDGSGKVRGFEVVESTRIDDDEVVFFIPEAFALVVRAPDVPQGAPHGASVRASNDEGQSFALRWIAAYDAGVAADTSLVSAFMAATALPLAVVDESTGQVDLVTSGGAVKVTRA
jgi:hypothetical protein